MKRRICTDIRNGVTLASDWSIFQPRQLPRKGAILDGNTWLNTANIVFDLVLVSLGVCVCAHHMHVRLSPINPYICQCVCVCVYV